MKKCTCIGLGLIASIALTPNLYAQVPDAAAAAPAAPAKNLWSFFCLTPEQSAKCKDKICNSPLGEMLKNAAKPITLMSGGLLFGKCGVPTAEDLAKLKMEGKEGGAEGAAAQIKKSEADAKARREAMRYLGTVDCNWWPEAREALINGLGADPNECVRLEAALSLLRGCCCNKEVMEALKHSANGSENKFGKRENSWRVRETASEALANCAAIYVEMEKTPEQKLKEGGELPPPQAQKHGKGLLGIVASATIVPAFTPPPSKAAAPVAREHTAMTSPVAPVVPAAPAPVQVVRQPEKRKLFQRIDWPSYQTKQSSTAERVIVTPAEIPITPAWNPALQPAAVPANAYSANGYFNAAPAGNRPAEDTVVPTRGIVIFDANGAR